MNSNIIKLGKEYLLKSYQFLQDSILNLEHSRFDTSINRAYYSVFHAMCACLCIIQISDFKKHSFVIAKFREAYIKTEKFDKVLSAIIDYLSKYRNECDYNVAFRADHDAAVKGVDLAKHFYDMISSYINNIKVE